MSVVIVGAGHGGVQVADTLRSEGYRGEITIVGDDPAPPYQRPPLSKDYLTPGHEAGPLPLRAESFFTEKRIALLEGPVIQIDRGQRRIRLADGRHLPYDHLVLATGARARKLDCDGSLLDGIHTLKTLSDAEKLHEALKSARSLVIIGGGFIGLELAAAATLHGCRVTVLEFAPLPMGRALSLETADWFAMAHREFGVDLRLGEGISSFRGREGGAVEAVVSTSGTIYPADLAVVGIGVIPNDELASGAGLRTSNGIEVDAMLRTSDQYVLALGDCASFPNAHAGAPTRLESVQNATDQGRHAARTILGAEEAYTELPWFWSVQGPHRLQIAGLRENGDDTVMIGDPTRGKFSVLCFRDGELKAVESVGSPADHSSARRILAAGRRPSLEEASQTGFSLRAFAKAACTEVGANAQ